jgi:anti-sigma regulatory factor (Ser/Thr protein kinase)
MPISRIRNIVTFDQLDKPTIGSEFIVLLKEILAENSNDIVLDFSRVSRIYPNTAIPLSSIFDYYRNHENINFIRFDDNFKIDERYILKPLKVSDNEEILLNSPLNKVWRFTNSEDIKILVDSFLSHLRRKKEFNPGFLDTLDWSLYEIMDNVIQHSGKDYGFIMSQIHHQKKHIAFCIGDDGQGIFNSLKNSVHKPESPLEALKFAISEGITRDKSIGQGNGMYGLHQIVTVNRGRLSIISNSALYKLDEGKLSTLINIPSISSENGGTIVDFQLDYENDVTIEEALIFKGKPHINYVNYYLESLENEEGDLEYILKDWRDGIGTRPSGKKLRTEILNNYRQTKRRIIIDFVDLRVISSSFADEVLGKLLIELGFFNFNNLVKLKNMSPLIQQIVQRSVAQRMAESLEK